MKGSASVEFMVILSLMLIIFLSLVSSTYDKIISAGLQAQRLYAKAEVELAASKINQATISGDGTNLTIGLSGQLKTGHNYTISILPLERVADLQWEDLHETAPIINGNISGTLTSINASLNVSNVNGNLLVKYA